MKIISADVGKMPEKMTDPMPQLTASLEDGTRTVLFTYYPDELTFLPEEFIGLTVEEGKELKRIKDVAYLRS